MESPCPMCDDWHPPDMTCSDWAGTKRASDPVEARQVVKIPVDEYFAMKADAELWRKERDRRRAYMRERRKK